MVIAEVVTGIAGSLLLLCCVIVCWRKYCRKRRRARRGKLLEMTPGVEPLGLDFDPRHAGTGAAQGGVVTTGIGRSARCNTQTPSARLPNGMELTQMGMHTAI